MTTNKRSDVTADNGCQKKNKFNLNVKQNRKLKFEFTAAPAAKDRVKWVTKAVSSADGNIFRCVLFVTRVVFTKYKFTIYKKKKLFICIHWSNCQRIRRQRRARCVSRELTRDTFVRRRWRWGQRRCCCGEHVWLRQW